MKSNFTEAQAQGRAAGVAADQKALTLDDIFTEGGLTGPSPEEGKWSPDGKLYSYVLRSADGAAGDLWAVDLQGNSRILVPNATLTRLHPSVEKTIKDEREKERLTRYSVAGYLWSPDSRSILFTSSGYVYVHSLNSGSTRPLLPELSGLKDPKFSPDGKWVSFLRESDIWIVPLSGGSPRRLTQGGSKNVLNGDLDWVYPEEFSVRTGYHWSPDSRHIAFLQLDQTVVGETPIVDFLLKPHATVEMQKYPKAGQQNPRARAGIVSLEGVQSWIDLKAEYIPRIQWADAGNVSLQLLNREQNELDLYLWNIESRRSRHVLKEKDEAWVNVTDDMQFTTGDRLLWASERNGYNHLYLFERSGKLIRRLTDGKWEVVQVKSVDPQGRWVYFTATKDGPIQRHLYRARLDGSEIQKLTMEEGSHTVTPSPDSTYYVDVASSFLKPAQHRIVSTLDSSSKTFYRPRTIDQFGLIAPQVIDLQAKDGAPIRVMLLRSDLSARDRRLPLLVYVYGGPHAPVIHDDFGGERFLWHQWMAMRGYVVAYIDDRTSAGMSHKYETALYKKFGFVELQDHREAISYLKSLPFVDGERIGIWGWSGGGYTTCFNMCNAGDIFKAGVAVAPLVDFEDYDTIWTERYMGLPQANKEAYAQSSAPTHAAKLTGRLLLIHGTADDNVHLQNSIQMAQKLIEARKMFDIFLYPRKTHSLSGAATRRHLYEKITGFFDEHLRH